MSKVAWGMLGKISQVLPSHCSVCLCALPFLLSQGVWGPSAPLAHPTQPCSLPAPPASHTVPAPPFTSSYPSQTGERALPSARTHSRREPGDMQACGLCLDFLKKIFY